MATFNISKNPYGSSKDLYGGDNITLTAPFTYITGPNSKGLPENIQTINDLEELLGEARVAKLFMQYYIKLIGDKLRILDELKDADVFNIE